MQFDQFTIRLLNTNDLDAYFALVQRNRPRLANYFTGTYSHTGSYEDTRAFLEDMLHRASRKLYFPYVVAEGEKLIGFLDLKNIDWNIPKAEVGCYTDAAYAGKGITRQVFALWCSHCFAEYGFQKLFLRAHTSNTAAIRIAEQCNFQQEGLLRREYKTSSGELLDLLYYGRLR